MAGSRSRTGNYGSDAVTEHTLARAGVGLKWWQTQRATDIMTKCIVTLVLGIGLVLVMIPILWMLSVSFKTKQELYVVPPVWIPRTFAWQNYVAVVTGIPFWRLLQNTLVLTGGRLLGTMIAGSVVAYGFSRFRAPGRDTLFLLVLATMMLPYQVTLVPRFILFSKLHWLGSLKPLIVPTWFGGGAFYIFLLRQFFMTIPLEYDEAALIDGASRWQIFTRILLPLSKPALASVAIFTIRWSWNDFIGPLVYLDTMADSTLSLGLMYFRDIYQPQWNHLMAMAVMLVIPLLVLYFFAQRLFIQGVVMTGVKG